MKNYLFPGDSVTLPAPADVKAGAFVQVGSLGGVAQADAASGEDVVLVRRGGFDLAKTEAEAWTVGQKIYWNGTAGEMTGTAAGNVLVGAALAVAANPSTTGWVVLDGGVLPEAEAEA